MGFCFHTTKNHGAIVGVAHLALALTGWRGRRAFFSSSEQPVENSALRCKGVFVLEMWPHRPPHDQVAPPPTSGVNRQPARTDLRAPLFLCVVRTTPLQRRAEFSTGTGASLAACFFSFRSGNGSSNESWSNGVADGPAERTRRYIQRGQSPASPPDSAIVHALDVHLLGPLRCFLCCPSASISWLVPVC